jgi:hypothetical protein
MTTQTPTPKPLPEIELFRTRNALESPAHMIDIAIQSFSPHQAAYSAGHAQLNSITYVSPEQFKRELNAISSQTEFTAAHASAVWAAETIANNRIWLAQRTDFERTDRFIARQAAKYGVNDLPKHFGFTAIGA